MPEYFLAKTDPETFSISDFDKEKITTWDGVHNYQAINVIKTWKIGDVVLIYHSIQDKAIVGVAKVVSEPIQNLNDKRYSWISDLEILNIFEKEKWITLKEIKENVDLFPDLLLIRHSRLSVMNLPKNFVNWLKTIKKLNL
jgi:predicted RNA-binding protein with PUA-like domain